MVTDKKTKKIICTHFSKGKVHDFKLLQRSKLPLNKNKKIQVDSGYQGLQKIHENTTLPKKKSKHRPLTKKEIKENLKLSKSRVAVEHIIGKIKVFRIISERYRNRRKNHALRMNLICGIYNFEL